MSVKETLKKGIEKIIKAGKPMRARPELSPEESLKRTQEFNERKEGFIATITESKN